MGNEVWQPETSLGEEVDQFARALIKKFPAKLEPLERDEIIRVLSALLGLVKKKEVDVPSDNGDQSNESSTSN